MGLGELTKVKANRVNTVLGIDASTNSLAFCLYGANGPQRWGEINFQGANMWERLSYGQKVMNGMSEQLRADLIVFESAVFVQNKKTVILLAYSFGALISTLVANGTSVEEVSPLLWQNAIGNKALTKSEKELIKIQNPGKTASWYSNANRNFRKTRTMQWVKNTYGINVESDNVSDAIAIASVGFDKFARPTI